MAKAHDEGWLEPLSPKMSNLLRSGRSEFLFNVLRSPDRGGLSDEEFLAWFRMQPTAFLYEELSKIESLREDLDAEVDAWFDNTIRQGLSVHGVGFSNSLVLAAAKGRPEVPGEVWRMVKTGYRTDGFIEIDMFLRNRFETKDFSNKSHEWAGDFLKTDPKAFRFDPQSRKYRLNKP